jgi:hypothetical protein
MLETILSTIDWKSLTVNAIIGYVLAWVYFFITLNTFQKVFGKINGAVINYSMSYLVWILVVFIISKINPIV